jgi:fumarylacetoacetase
MAASTVAALKSWVAYEADTDFPIQNLPYGVFTAESTGGIPHIGVAIGLLILDLYVLADAGLFQNTEFLQGGAVFKEPALNAFMGLGQLAWREARALITDLLNLDGANQTLQTDKALQARALVAQSSASMQVPSRIGDYTDFYASRNHAYNVGVMFRGKDNALQPNWTWLPVGYHGRASSIVPSGTALKRPCGQLTGADNAPPAVHGESKTLDYELELGFFVGTGNALGEPIAIEDAFDKIFGVVLLNDWSARDIQKWEYVPLGPFGAKNFGSTISPWVVTMDALAPFLIENQPQDPAPLPYLAETGKRALDIALTVSIRPEGAAEETVLTTSNSKHLYWTAGQMLAHHTVTGCNMQPGDLLGSGTISGTEEHEFGSLLELTWRGSKSLTLKTGETRKFIQDGDTVTIRGAAQGDGYKIGFGDCGGKILPSHLKK